MNNEFNIAQFSGSTKPGEIYVLVDKGYGFEEPDNLYTIRTDEEVVGALQMYVDIVCWEYWTFRSVRSLGINSDNDLEIELMLYDTKFEEDVRLVLILHRVKSFIEELAIVRKSFDRENVLLDASA